MNRFLINKVVDIPGHGAINLNCSIENTEDYFLMAVRKNNKKRNFLFVSQLLGKHIPIPPYVLFDACFKLCRLYAEDKKLEQDDEEKIICKQDTLIIGFAETATAMGHAVFDCFKGSCNYVHTTRNQVVDYEFAFEFEEEHCHAPEQFFFLQKEAWIKDAQEIIIVDDEVTTGKTIRNIIGQIEKHYPGKSYSIITFLDWRNDDNLNRYKKFAKEKGLDIRFYSLLQGSVNDISIDGNHFSEMSIKEEATYWADNNGWLFHYCNMDRNTFISAEKGMSYHQKEEAHAEINMTVDMIIPKLSGKKRAVLGTGEFMYFPLLCAKRFPDENYFNATTRSPVIAYDHPRYGIKKAFHFNCPTDPDRKEYLYNSNILGCDEVVLFIEYAVPKQQLNSLLASLDEGNYKYKHVVFVKGNEQ